MKTNIWILNHYASDMYFDHGGRHYNFAKFLRRAGYAPVIFGANSKHGKAERFFETDALWEEHVAEEIDTPFVFVRARTYNGNGKQRVLNMIDFYRNVKKAAKEYAAQHGRPDVIFASSVHPLTLVAGIQLAKQFGVKCVCEVRDLWPESIVVYSNRFTKDNPLIKLLYRGEKWIYKRADALVFTMEGAYDYITEQGWEKDIPRSKVHYINNGVDLEQFDYNKEHFHVEDPELNDPSTFKVVYTGSVRRGIGAASFWYNTGVYPISLETASNRMQLNLDGTVTMQCGETEIGQGADTAYAQMTAKAVGLKSYKDVHVVSCQDTDITPTGLGAYASRQTYMEGFAIDQTGRLLRQKILAYAAEMLGCSAEELDIVEGNVVRKDSGAVEMDLSHLAMTAQYNPVHSEHITAESTATIRSNAYSFGCTFAEVEVDIPMCKVTLKRIINVHDCGSLINPALAEAQVHGGMSMGIGYGLSEQLLFDEKTGKPLNNNLLDYKLSTVMDHPDLEALFVENAEPTSPFGTKALGEPPACSPAPAIRSAIYNATGVSIDTTPITPHVLYRAFKEAGLIHDEKEGD